MAPHQKETTMNVNDETTHITIARAKVGDAWVVGFDDGGNARHATRADAFSHASAWFKASRYQQADVQIIERRRFTK